jgi:hypothetical protein
MEGILPWLVRWACRMGTRYFCPALAALVGPVQNIFFLTVHFFNFCPCAAYIGMGGMRIEKEPCQWDEYVYKTS